MGLRNSLKIINLDRLERNPLLCAQYRNYLMAFMVLFTAIILSAPLVWPTFEVEEAAVDANCFGQSSAASRLCGPQNFPI